MHIAPQNHLKKSLTMASFAHTSLTIPLMKMISILVVDDDFASLAIASAMLKKMNYQVTTAQSPYLALSTLRACRDFDLVITDLHMPGMNGLQLKQHIDEEFKLPVIIMSGDDDENVILESYARGVVLYLVKPVNLEDLKNIGQYVNEKGKGISPVIEVSEDVDIAFLLDNNTASPIHSYGHYQAPAGCATSASSSVNNKDNSNGGENQTKKRKYLGDGKEIDHDDQNSEHLPAPKKRKITWTFWLHFLFLEAITYIGFDKAVPKKILEVMAVPWLTREHIASHLQKYRLFLKKVTRMGLDAASALTDRELRSTFAVVHSMMLYQQQYLSYLRQHNQVRVLYFPMFFQPRADLNNVGNSSTQHQFMPSSSAFSNGYHGVYQTSQFNGTTDKSTHESVNRSASPNGYGNQNANAAPNDPMLGNDTEFSFDEFLNYFQSLNQNQNQGGDVGNNINDGNNVVPPLDEYHPLMDYQNDNQNHTEGGDVVINCTDGNNVVPPLEEYHPLMDNQNENQTQNVRETVNNAEVNNNVPSNFSPENQLVWDDDLMDLFCFDS